MWEKADFSTAVISKTHSKTVLNKGTFGQTHEPHFNQCIYKENHVLTRISSRNPTKSWPLHTSSTCKRDILMRVRERASQNDRISIDIALQHITRHGSKLRVTGCACELSCADSVPRAAHLTRQIVGWADEPGTSLILKITSPQMVLGEQQGVTRRYTEPQRDGLQASESRASSDPPWCACVLIQRCVIDCTVP